MRKITAIVIHCSAGYGDVDSVKRYWRENLGWKSPGYHRFIDRDGTVHVLAGLDQVTNGVRGHNSNSVHISYQGGVRRDDYSVAEDTRTPMQKQAIIRQIRDVLAELCRAGQDVSDVQILGHRDFSPDKNGNGVVDSWERIKECPSFDAIPEYDIIQKAFS